MINNLLYLITGG